jgi:hypothetical protein
VPLRQAGLHHEVVPRRKLSPRQLPHRGHVVIRIDGKPDPQRNIPSVEPRQGEREADRDKKKDRGR